MIRLRELAVSKITHGTGRACSGCGDGATHQIIGQTVVGNDPAMESIDLCDRCGARLADKLALRHVETPRPRSKVKKS